MCEILTRLCDKPGTLKQLATERFYRKYDPIDIFDDGRYPDQLSYPNAVVKVPNFPKEKIKYSLAKDIEYNELLAIHVCERVRKYTLDFTKLPVEKINKLTVDRSVIITELELSNCIYDRTLQFYTPLKTDSVD